MNRYQVNFLSANFYLKEPCVILYLNHAVNTEPIEKLVYSYNSWHDDKSVPNYSRCITKRVKKMMCAQLVQYWTLLISEKPLTCSDKTITSDYLHFNVCGGKSFFCPSSSLSLIYSAHAVHPVHLLVLVQMNSCLPGRVDDFFIYSFCVRSGWLFKLSSARCKTTFTRYYCALRMGDFIVFAMIISAFLLYLRGSISGKKS